MCYLNEFLFYCKRIFPLKLSGSQIFYIKSDFKISGEERTGYENDQGIYLNLVLMIRFLINFRWLNYFFLKNIGVYFIAWVYSLINFLFSALTDIIGYFYNKIFNSH